MSNIEIDDLLVALDDVDNHSILNLTSEKIKNMKYTVLNDLGITNESINDLMSILENYVYADEIPDIKIGSFIRWIPLKDPNKINLTRGGYVCDLNICEKGVYIVMKNQFNKYFQVSLNNCLIFRKLNNEEKILLAAMNYLNR